MKKDTDLMGWQAVEHLAELKVDRRSFIKLSGASAGGFLLAGFMSSTVAENSSDVLVSGAELNAFIRVSSDGKITIYSSLPEMGQGVSTALPMIIAEELGARWEDVEVVAAPINEQKYGAQGAGGSTSIPRTWDQMRRMGASAREMFISAGSLVMELPKEELSARDSRVVHETGRFMTFGQLATLAAKQDVPDPDEVQFKAREDYTIIGTSVSGVDNLVISTGAALFGIDTRVPDMLYAAYQKCPAIGGRFVSANLDEIKKMPGIVDAFPLNGNGDVRQLLDGVAIVGSNTHSVFQAKDLLEIEWDEGQASKDSWTQMVERANELKGNQGSETVIEKGDVEQEFSNTENRVLESFYEYPFVAHFCMEPMNCTADYRKGSSGEKDSLELWLPHQMATRAVPTLEEMFGLNKDRITINPVRLGGSFGRRIYTEYACEAVAISKQIGKPVKLTWTREDDVRHDFYRVGGFQSVKGAVDKNGKLVAFQNHFIGMHYNNRPVSGSRFSSSEFPLLNIENAHVTKTMFDIKTPCGPWRAPGANTTAFVVQSFLDELAHASGRDYLDFLLEIMGEPRWFDPDNVRSLNTGRARGVIQLAAKKAGWGKTLPQGRGLGLAFHFSHAGHIAEVAEVEVDQNKRVRVHKVVVAVDVGPIINMSGAVSQVQGSVIDGLSTMAGQKITMESGRIEQSNLHDYPVLRLPQAPLVEAHFIQSEYRPTGLGEPALPPCAPAIANAIFAATGERVRKMPIIEEGFTLV